MTVRFLLLLRDELARVLRTDLLVYRNMWLQDGTGLLKSCSLSNSTPRSVSLTCPFAIFQRLISVAFCVG